MTIFNFLVGLYYRYKRGRPIINCGISEDGCFLDKICCLDFLQNSILKDLEIGHREVVNKSIAIEDPNRDFDVDDGDVVLGRLRQLGS